MGVLVSLALLLTSTAATAQQATGETETAEPGAGDAADAAKPVCFTRRSTQEKGQNFDFEVRIPEGKASLVTERGYVGTACSWSAERIAAFEKGMCEMGALNNAVQNRTIEVLGVDPREMCAAAAELKTASDQK